MGGVSIVGGVWVAYGWVRKKKECEEGEKGTE